MTKIGPLKPYVADNSSRGVIHSLEICGNPHQKSVISYAFGNTFEKREISYAHIQVIFPRQLPRSPGTGAPAQTKLGSAKTTLRSGRTTT